MRYDLRSNDRELKLMESIASAEGMIDALAKDDGGDMIETYGQTCPEGQRTLIIFDEMKALFSNSRPSNYIHNHTTPYRSIQLPGIP